VSDALAGLLVLDLTTVRSGPTCTKVLADFGADVVRVERPGDAEGGRVFFDTVDLHRNKRSIAVNLQEPRGVAVVRRLAARADVVVENYRPDVKRRLGIDYETLSGDNPRLVYGSISGFGQDGPYRDRPGYDQIVQGMSGLMWLTGTPESAPLRIGIPIGDLLAGYFCAMGIVVAIVERARSGRGQHVTTSLLAALAGSLSFQAAKYLNTGEVPPPVGNHHPLTTPMGVYRSKDGFLNLAVGNDDMWRRCCDALGLPGWPTIHGLPGTGTASSTGRRWTPSSWSGWRNAPPRSGSTRSTARAWPVAPSTRWTRSSPTLRSCKPVWCTSTSTKRSALSV
jgi:crotonobetainyl-CoA:carnitine CoA-transferase CaiB-like acyl-CoA transferase